MFNFKKFSYLWKILEDVIQNPIFFSILFFTKVYFRKLWKYCHISCMLHGILCIEYSQRNRHWLKITDETKSYNAASKIWVIIFFYNVADWCQITFIIVNGNLRCTRGPSCGGRLLSYITRFCVETPYYPT